MVDGHVMRGHVTHGHVTYHEKENAEVRLDGTQLPDFILQKHAQLIHPQSTRHA